jgi:hypothetical protein
VQRVRRLVAEAQRRDERQRELERESIREHYADPDTSEETKKWLRDHHDFLSK